jgi:hypothetical protein
MRIHTQPKQFPTKKLAADASESTSCTQRSSALLRLLQVILATELRYLQGSNSTPMLTTQAVIIDSTRLRRLLHH